VVSQPEPDVFTEEQIRERRKALRALMQRPLITARGKDADTFLLIRRHQTALNTWLSRNPGWGLFIDSETARLRKLPVDHTDTTRGVGGAKPFTRRRYALFCLALAALGQGERQTTLGKLFETVLVLASADNALADAGLRLDPNIRDHRRELVGAVHLMLELGLLQQVDGDENAYLDGRGDVLYQVNRSAMAWVLNLRRSPATVEAEDLETRMRTITEEPVPDSAEGRNRTMRTFLYRKLLDDPVLYYDRLDEDTAAYLQSQRAKIVREIETHTGLHAEIRREGIAMVDREGALTDLDMPSEGTEGHVTLLIAEYLGKYLEKGNRRVIGRVTLERHLAEMAREYSKFWRKAARAPEAIGPLLDEALYRLEALDLIEIDQDGIVPLPALARYALDEPRITTTTPSLFGEDFS